MKQNMLLLVDVSSLQIFFFLLMLRLLLYYGKFPKISNTLFHTLLTNFAFYVAVSLNI